MIRHISLLLLSIIMVTCRTYPLLYDNRFFPLYPDPSARFLSYQAHPASSWYASIRGIFIGADRSYLEDQDDDAELFKMYGEYDEAMINRALQKARLTSGSLLQPDQQLMSSIPWDTPGKVSLRGCAVETEIYFMENLSAGGSFFVGNMLAHSNNTLQNHVASASAPGSRAALIAANTQMLNILGLTDSCYSSLVFGDIDCYLKGRITADYWYTLHHVDLSARFGIYAPSGSRVQLTSPVSFPVGGNGHLGVYGQLDCMVLLKDLMSVGCTLQLSKRLPRTLLQRLPALQEPTNYGALVLPTYVNPGATWAFNPYIQVGGIRGGLGLMASYYLVHHGTDTIDVSQKLFNLYDPNLILAEERSAWGSDHFSACIWYDCGYESDSSSLKPLISCTVDIPWKGPVTTLVPKAHAISLRIEFEL